MSCLAVVGCMTSVIVSAQNAWVAAGIPIRTEQMHSIYTDTLAGAVYFCGTSSIDGDFITDDCGISVYYHGQWDTLGTFHGAPESIVRWHDTLIVSGDFIEINGEPIANCAYYDSVTWHSFGTFSPVAPSYLRELNGDLYALGAFMYADGHLCNGIAKREGTEWVSVGVEGFADPDTFHNIIHGIARYNGNLVVGGHVNFSGTSDHGVGIQENGIWHPLGPGIQGTYGHGGAFANYQGELYVGGGIHVGEGNPGEGLLRWTGTEFVAVGEGLQNQNNQWAANVGVFELEVHNGLLYVAGTFWFAGHVPANGVATWDGTNWCGLGGWLDGSASNIAFLGDTLFASPWIYLDGENVNSGVRYVGNYPDTCTQFSTSILDPTLLPAATFHITLASDILTAHLPIGVSPCRIELLDGLGRVINAGSGTTVRFSTAGLAKGVYIVRAEGYGAQRVLLE